MSRLLPCRSPPHLLTEAAHGCLKPPPTGWLRRARLHLSYSMTLARLLDTTCHTTVQAGPPNAGPRVKTKTPHPRGRAPPPHSSHPPHHPPPPPTVPSPP